MCFYHAGMGCAKPMEIQQQCKFNLMMFFHIKSPLCHQWNDFKCRWEVTGLNIPPYKNKKNPYKLGKWSMWACFSLFTLISSLSVSSSSLSPALLTFCPNFSVFINCLSPSHLSSQHQLTLTQLVSDQLYSALTRGVHLSTDLEVYMFGLVISPQKKCCFEFHIKFILGSYVS